MLTRQCRLFVVLLILFLLLLLVLIVLLITGKIGYRLNSNQGTNHCFDSTCENGGTCLSLEKNYFCVCAEGWTGTNCTTGTDHCVGSPCENGGTCLSLEKNYLCHCAAGWKGTDCTTRTDHCFNFPCKNGGTCLSQEKDYFCHCAAGWKGTDCTISTNHCVGSPCENGGTCLSLEMDYFCHCAAGWKGINCTTNTNHCLDSPCKNGGTCLSLEKDHTCLCDAGWKGTNCTTSTDNCVNFPCENGGTCLSLEKGYFCVCAAGWEGINCSTDFSSCKHLKTAGHSSGNGAHYRLNTHGQNFKVYCDMTENGGGWTLIARFSNSDSKNWMRDDGYWWYNQRSSQGQTTDPYDNSDMVSPAFWLVIGSEFKITRSDDSSHAALLRTTSNCLGGGTFRSKIRSFGYFTGCTSWANNQCRSSCSVTYGGSYQSTSGFSETRCSSNIQSSGYVGFWCDWDSGDGAVLMIGGGGSGCSRADHGIGITEENESTFQACSGDPAELDFGNDARSGSSSYSLNLWVR